jgi:hypothetical protein
MRLDCKASTLEICASSNLLMYYGVALTWQSTHLSSVQTAFDNDNSRFENIVHHADIILAHTKKNTRPSFTFEIGVITPLYFVATKCRHPTIRRRALSLLKKAPPQRARGRRYPRQESWRHAVNQSSNACAAHAELNAALAAALTALGFLSVAMTRRLANSVAESFLRCCRAILVRREQS